MGGWDYGEQAQDNALREMSIYRKYKRKYKRKTEIYKRLIPGEMRE